VAGGGLQLARRLTCPVHPQQELMMIPSIVILPYLVGGLGSFFIFP
jgi:hypothetical protein